MHIYIHDLWINISGKFFTLFHYFFHFFSYLQEIYSDVYFNFRLNFLHIARTAIKVYGDKLKKDQNHLHILSLSENVECNFRLKFHCKGNCFATEMHVGDVIYFKILKV